ncbi:MAG: nucleotide-binding protein [Bacteroidota bacterium]
MSNPNPKIFIASSSEGLNVAYALQENLEHNADVTVWTQDIFKASNYTLESLVSSISKFDFAIFIFAFEDISRIRNEELRTTRDNVLFELGLFIGNIGRKRCFIVHPKLKEKFHIPSDLLGITPLRYKHDREDENMVAATGPVCHHISRIIKNLGIRNTPQDVQASKRTPDTLMLNSMVNGALETVCRAVSVPSNPHDARIRVFIFRKVNRELICSHFWSLNPTEEMVGKLKFDMDKEPDKSTAVVLAATEGKGIRKRIDPSKQKELSKQKTVADNLKIVLAAPISDSNGNIWGVVDFDTSNEKGEEILNTEEADGAIFQLTKHLKLIFSLDE